MKNYNSKNNELLSMKIQQLLPLFKLIIRSKDFDDFEGSLTIGDKTYSFKKIFYDNCYCDSSFPCQIVNGITITCSDGRKMTLKFQLGDDIDESTMYDIFQSIIIEHDLKNKGKIIYQFSPLDKAKHLYKSFCVQDVLSCYDNHFSYLEWNSMNPSYYSQTNFSDDLSTFEYLGNRISICDDGKEVTFSHKNDVSNYLSNCENKDFSSFNYQDELSKLDKLINGSNSSFHPITLDILKRALSELEEVRRIQLEDNKLNSSNNQDYDDLMRKRDIVLTALHNETFSNEELTALYKKISYSITKYFSNEAKMIQKKKQIASN